MPSSEEISSFNEIYDNDSEDGEDWRPRRYSLRTVMLKDFQKIPD